MRLNFARSLAVSLALAAMVLRAVLPDGWMPAVGASPFVICSVDGTHKDGKAPAQTPSRHAPCAFASSAPLSPPAMAATIPVANGEAQRLAASFANDVIVRAPLHRPNAARAPPAFS
jgi:hypothetical protein